MVVCCFGAMCHHPLIGMRLVNKIGYDRRTEEDQRRAERAKGTEAQEQTQGDLGQNDQGLLLDEISGYDRQSEETRRKQEVENNSTDRRRVSKGQLYNRRGLRREEGSKTQKNVEGNNSRLLSVSEGENAGGLDEGDVLHRLVVEDEAEIAHIKAETKGYFL